MTSPRIVAAVFALALAATQAYADLLLMNHSAVTDNNGSINMVPIPQGTPFAIHAVFDTGLILDSGPGFAVYGVTEITAEVGGVSYDALNVFGNYVAYLLDPSNGSFTGFNIPALVSPASGILAPAYLSASPAFVASAPAPTTFSGYFGSLVGEIAFGTASGDLFLSFDTSAPDGMAASITPVPESGTAVAGLGLVTLVLATCRRLARA